MPMKWIQKWAKFAETGKGMPGKVYNKELAERIEELRTLYGYSIMDSKVELCSTTEVFFIGEKFWQHFVKYYGCDMMI